MGRFEHAESIQEPASEDEQPHCEPPLPEFTFQSLPPELLLEIFSFLELKPYITSHAVCKEWQRLLPLVDIHPIRRRLFNIFHHMLESLHFLDTRPWTLKNLQSFDRQGYVNALLLQYPAIPEEFRIWILEWPARMAIFAMWPGLPIVKHRATCLQWAEGVNWIAYGSPMLTTVGYKERYLKPRFIPALLVWKFHGGADSLLFEKDIPELFGRVLSTSVHYGEAVTVYPPPPTDSDLEDEYDESYINTPFADWITYLEDTWDRTLSRFPEPVFPSNKVGSIESEPIAFPIAYHFAMPGRRSFHHPHG